MFEQTFKNIDDILHKDAGYSSLKLLITCTALFALSTPSSFAKTDSEFSQLPARTIENQCNQFGDDVKAFGLFNFSSNDKMMNILITARCESDACTGEISDYSNDVVGGLDSFHVAHAKISGWDNGTAEIDLLNGDILIISPATHKMTYQRNMSNGKTIASSVNCINRTAHISKWLGDRLKSRK